MTLEEAVDLLHEHCGGDVRTDGRTVKVSVGGVTGDLTRAGRRDAGGTRRTERAG